MVRFQRLIRTAVYAAAFILLSAVLCIAASALTVIDSMDSGEGWDNAQLENGNTVEGKGAITCSSADLLLTSRVFSAPIDMSSLADGDVLHVWIYIEDADKLTSNGQLELTSSGICDVKETSWALLKDMFKDGWNELNLTIYNAGQDEADLTAINFIRFYEFTDGQNSWAIDDLAFGPKDDFVSGAKDADKPEAASDDSDDSEETATENNMGGFVSKNNNTAAGSGPINKYMYYVIFSVSVLNVGAVALISNGRKK